MNGKVLAEWAVHQASEEGRKRKAEGGRWKAEGEGRKTEGGRRKGEGGRGKSECRKREVVYPHSEASRFAPEKEAVSLKALKSERRQSILLILKPF